MSKVLIAIASCNRDTKNGYNEAIRKTWAKDLDCDYKFFVGDGWIDLKEDEIPLDCPDTYLALPFKTLEILRWALSNGYDYIFKCDTDTFIVPKNLLSSGFENYDHVGTFNGPLTPETKIYGSLYPWASGGSGYWLSKEAANYILSQGVDHRATCPRLNIPCEDLWVGQLLGPRIMNGTLKAIHSDRYNKNDNPDYTTDISSHYCSEGRRRVFDVEWMYKHYEINKNR